MSGSPVRLPPPDLPAETRSALIVATTTYEDPSLRRLRAPATDATDFAAVLADPTIGGFEVTPVIDRPAHEVRVTMEGFLADAAPGDLVVLYVSCHGITDARRRLHFAARDTLRSRLASTGVDSVWVHDRLEECRARRQVIILDCCFSGAFARGAKGTETLDLDRLVEPGRGRAVLTASNATEYSFEATSAVELAPDSPAPGSVFTAALIAGLRDGAADRDGDGFVSVDEAYAYAYQQVRASGVAQTPQRSIDHGEGQILLARNPVGRPVTPAAFPEALRTALDSPLPYVRIGAIHELKHWLSSDDATRVLAAEQELSAIADTDIPRVASVAREALQALPRSAGPTTPQPAVDTAPLDDSPRASTSHSRPHAESTSQDPPEPEPDERLDFAEAVAVLEGHAGGPLAPTAGGSLSALAFSPDGRLLASGGSDDTVRLWRPQSGVRENELTGHTDWVASLAFSPDGDFLATGSHDRTVRLWAPQSGRPLRALTGHRAPVRGVAFSPGGSVLASASPDRTVRLWDPRSGRNLRTLTGHSHWVVAVSFSPDGRILASASLDKTVRLVRVWDQKPHSELSPMRTITGHTGWVTAVAFSPDGQILASGSHDKTVRLWDAMTGRSLRTLTGHAAAVHGVAFSPDGHLLASCSQDGTVRLWDPHTGRHLHTLTGHQGWVCQVAFSPTGEFLASSGNDLTIRLWR